MNERYQLPYPFSKSGITAFPIAFQVYQEESADVLLYTPGIISDGTTNRGADFELWVYQETVSSSSEEVLLFSARSAPKFIGQAGIPASIPWTGNAKAVFQFVQRTGAAVAAARLAFTITPYNYPQINRKDF